MKAAGDLGELRAIGCVSSPLTDRASAPKQGDEGAPEATIEVDPEFGAGLEGIAAGDEVLVDGTPVLDIKPVLGQVGER